MNLGMNSKLLLVLVLLVINHTLSGQILLGVKGGASTYDLGLIQDLDINQTYTLSIDNARWGYHVGVLFQFNIGAFVIQPEVLYNYNQVDYAFSENGQSPNVLSEKYQILDFPMLVGLSAGPLRIMGGGIGHYYLNSESEFSTINGFESIYPQLQYGWQAGLGFDFFNAMIDLRYEGNFSKFGEHFYFFGEQFNFSSKPSRFLASLALTLN